MGNLESHFRQKFFTLRVLAACFLLILASTAHQEKASASPAASCAQVSQLLTVAGANMADNDVLSFGLSLCSNSCANISAWFITGGADLLSVTALGRNASGTLSTYIQSTCNSQNPEGGNGGGGIGNHGWNPHANCPKIVKNMSSGAGLAHKSCIWNKDYPGTNFARADMHLSKSKKSDLSKSNFSNTNLAFAEFDSVSLAGVNFTNANLQGAVFYDCNLEGANFTGSNLDEAKFENIKFGRANLSGASLKGITTSFITGIPRLPSGFSIQLTDQWIAGPGGIFGAKNIVSLHSLAGADLGDTDFTGTTFSKNFKSSDLRGSPKLPSGYLLTAGVIVGPGVDLGHADLRLGDLSNVRSGSVKGKPKLPAGWLLQNGLLLGPKANLSGMDLAGVNFHQVDLSQANLYGVSSGKCLGNPKLPGGYKLVLGYLVGPGVKLSNINLANQDLSNVSLADARLNKVDLRGSNLANMVSGPFYSNYVLLDSKYGLRMADFNYGPKMFIFGPGVVISDSPERGGTSFRDISLANTDLSNMRVESGVTFIQVSFTNSNLTGAQFKGVKSRNTSFEGSNLTNAVFEAVNFSNNSFLRANFEGAKLAGYFDYFDQYFAYMSDLSAPYHFWSFYSDDSSGPEHLIGPMVDLGGLDLSDPNPWNDYVGCDVSGANLTGTKVSWWFDGCKKDNVTQ